MLTGWNKEGHDSKASSGQGPSESRIGENYSDKCPVSDSPDEIKEKKTLKPAK